MIRVGILGAGGMGNAHARQYNKRSDVEVFIFDQSEERRVAYADRWQVTPVSSIEELLSKADVVDVCLPTHIHTEFALKAIQAGKSVLVEKPMTRTFEEAITLIEAAEKARVTLMPAQVVRFFPEYVKANALVKAGKVGTPAAARLRRGGAAPSGMGGWFLDHKLSGGILLDLAIHDFDWLRWTFGEVKHLYSRSVASQSKSGADYALTTLTFECGLVAHVESTWMDPSGFRTTLEVAGSEGVIEHDSRANTALRTVKVVDGVVVTQGDNNLAPTDDPYYKQIDAFLTAATTGTHPPVTGRDGLMAVSIALAAIESAETGRVVVPRSL